MYTLILIICCLGFFCLYNTSRKARLAKHGLVEAWLQSHQQPAKFAGLGCMLISVTGLILLDGAVMGVLHFLLLLMTAACYITALAPFRLLKLNHILTLGIIAFLLEYLIF